jgi:hypothetical protein
MFQLANLKQPHEVIARPVLPDQIDDRVAVLQYFGVLSNVPVDFKWPDLPI